MKNLPKNLQRLLMIAAALLTFSVSTLFMPSDVHAVMVNAVTNGDWGTGDETGWTRWRAPWGSTENWGVTSSGTTPYEGTTSGGGGNGSFGWYQIVNVPINDYYSITADWSGTIGGAGWAEVMLFSVVMGTSASDIVTRIDTGNAADISYKKDSWGMNLPTIWSWEDAELSPHPAGNGGIIHNFGWLVVATKLGGFPMGSVSWDNISIMYDDGTIPPNPVPEPSTFLLLGAGLAGLVAWRRKRS